MRTHLWTKDTDDWEVLAEGEGQIQQNCQQSHIYIPDADRKLILAFLSADAGIINGDYSTSGIVVLTHELNDETVKMLVEESVHVQSLSVPKRAG